MNKTYSIEHLPGGNLIQKGLDDLNNGTLVSEEALLVLIAGSKLRALNLPVKNVKPIEAFEHQLYRLCLKKYDAAYQHYRSLFDRLVSFTRALESIS